MQLAETCLKTDKRVLSRIKQLVKSGVRRVQEVKRHIKIYVENELFDGTQPPEMCDARFWPSAKSIMNCIYRTVRKLR